MLLLTPDKDLEFQRPFTSLVKQHLSVKNSSESFIAYKIKTTAPKQYCVKPNAGKIPPGDSIDIQITLQAMKSDPPLDFKCKDKFLIQSIIIPSDLLSLDSDSYQSRINEVWNNAENIKKNLDSETTPIIGTIYEKKLRCVFISDIDSGKVSNDSPTASNSNDFQPPSDHSDKELKDARESLKRLQAQCDGYKSEIERLNSLRQRKVVPDSNSDKNVTFVRQQSNGGVPLILVLIICLISFLMGAYLM